MQDDVSKPIWREHLPLVVSGSLAVLVAIKLLALSKYDPETAIAILHLSGTSTVLIAAVVTSLPFALTQLLFDLLLRYLPWFAAKSTVERSAIAGAVIPLLGVCLAVVPVSLLLAPFAALALLLLLAWLSTRKDKRSPDQILREQPSSTEQRFARSSVFVYLLVTAINNPWIPAEALQDGSSHPYKAYVLGDRGDETAVLSVYGDDGIRYVKTSHLTRSLCEDTSWASKTVFGLFQSTAYPNCPDR